MKARPKDSKERAYWDLLTTLGIVVLYTAYECFKAFTTDPSPIHVTAALLACIIWYLTWFILLFAGIYAASTVHELGHIVAGKILKFRWSSTQIGPFLFTCPKKKPKLQYKGLPPRLLSQGLTSSTGMLPKGTYKQVARTRGLLLGGPIASLIWLAACIYLAVRYDFSFSLFRHAPFNLWVRNLALAIFTAFAAIKLVGSMFFERGRDADAKLIWRTYRDPEYIRLTEARRTAGAHLEAGLKFRDLDPQTVAFFESQPFHRRPHGILSLYYQDTRQWKKALEETEILLKPLNQKTEGHTEADQVLFYRAAFMDAMLGNLSRAEERIAEGDKRGPQTSYHRKRARIAILAREGKLDQAQTLAFAARSQLASEEDMSRPIMQAVEDSIVWALDAANLPHIPPVQR